MKIQQNCLWKLLKKNHGGTDAITASDCNVLLLAKNLDQQIKLVSYS